MRVLGTQERQLVDRARSLLATYDNMAEMIRLGAYRPGSDPGVDEAIRYYAALEGFLAQDKAERTDLAAGYGQLAEILAEPVGEQPETAAAHLPSKGSP